MTDDTADRDELREQLFKISLTPYRHYGVDADGKVGLSDTQLDQILNLIEAERREARIAMVDYFDQCPKNELMDWKGLFADTRKLLEAEAHLTTEEGKKG